MWFEPIRRNGCGGAQRLLYPGRKSFWFARSIARLYQAFGGLSEVETERSAAGMPAGKPRRREQYKSSAAPGRPVRTIRSYWPSETAR